ncbi:hypothetical protein V6N13_114477 [Hibiscus sabdariffa]|uniref:Uncharacterized protein n=1 Tax=Hibiscus sabdariffa TaxID=183260 RepID=A0ABR2U274_9ROSI
MEAARAVKDVSPTTSSRLTPPISSAPARLSFLHGLILSRLENSRSFLPMTLIGGFTEGLSEMEVALAIFARAVALSLGTFFSNCSLQQLQNVNIIDIDPKGGRRITSNGQRDLDQVAGRIAVAI